MMIEVHHLTVYAVLCILILLFNQIASVTVIVFFVANCVVTSVTKNEVNDVKVSEESKISSWQCDVDPSPEISIDASCLPLVDVNGESILRLYWFDAFEDHLKQPGVVFLFGKVWAESAKQHVSCCVSVKNIERCVYLLPRRYRVNVKTNCEDQMRPVTFVDVYQVS